MDVAAGAPLGVQPPRAWLPKRSSRVGITIGGSGLGALPMVIGLGGAIVVPLVALTRQSVAANPLDPSATAPGLSNYVALITTPTYLDAIVRTVRVSVISSAVSVTIGFVLVLALTLFRRREPRGSLHVFLLVAPLLAGPIVTVMGWVGLFSSGQLGYRLVNAARAVFGLETGRVVETELGMTIGLIHFLVPLVVLTLYPVVRGIPQPLLDASLVLGEPPLRTVWRVVLPLCRPGLMAATIVTLAMAASAFVNARFLGGERNLVLTTLVNQQMNTFNPTGAAASSVLLVVIGLALVTSYGMLATRLER
jgi:putative spermidine/putrescine transport system permease protein